VCQRTTPLQNACTADIHPLGGVRLQLNPGDMLKIRLVKKLPLIPDAKACRGRSLADQNPTNLYTHGLIVEPDRRKGRATHTVTTSSLSSSIRTI
jgi:L-ascorbate oxidase